MRTAVLLGLGAVVVCCGTLSALEKGAFHRSLWERHREAMAHVLKIAPNVRPDTIIALVNVRRDADPFGHAMWFDLALRLVYPGTPVSGILFYADRTPVAGDNLKVDGGRWKWDGTAFPPLVRDAGIENTIVIDYAASGKDALASSIPSYVCNAPCSPDAYHPSSRIISSISPRAIRRYRLDAPLW